MSIHIQIGIVDGGRSSFIQTFVVEAEPTREPIYLDPAAASYAALVPVLGGTPITASPGGGREAAIVTHILEVKKMMDDRYEFLEEDGPKLWETLSPLVLTVDEGELLLTELAD